MAKVTNYLLTMGGITLLFYFFGLIDQGSTGTMLNLVLNPDALQSSSLTSKLLLGFSGLGIIASSVLTRSFRSDLTVFAVFAGLMLNFGWDFIVIFGVLSSVSVALATLIIGPLLLLWLFTVMEWWRGVTT